MKQLKRELEDIHAKLSRILVQEKVISGGPLFDLCDRGLRRRGAVVMPPSDNFCLNTKHH